MKALADFETNPPTDVGDWCDFKLQTAMVAQFPSPPHTPNLYSKEPVVIPGPGGYNDEDIVIIVDEFIGNPCGDPQLMIP